MSKNPKKRFKTGEKTAIARDDDDSDEDVSSDGESTTDESSESSNSEDSDVSEASYDDERSMRRPPRGPLKADVINQIAQRVSRRIFDAVTPTVVDVMNYDPAPHEAYAQHFIINVCSGSSFNCASIAVKGTLLRVTLNGTAGFKEEAFDDYLAQRRADGWRNVEIRVSSKLTLCYNNGVKHRARDQKYLHAEIQQWMNILDFDDIEFGTNKPCCFYCASIMLAAGRRVASHGKIYGYSLPHALYSFERVGKRYFGSADFVRLRDADDASRRAFEVALKNKVKSLVAGSRYAKAMQTSVKKAYPPPKYADYKRGARKPAAVASGATNSTLQTHTASTSRR